MTWQAFLSKDGWGFGSAQRELHKYETSRLAKSVSPKRLRWPSMQSGETAHSCCWFCTVLSRSRHHSFLLTLAFGCCMLLLLLRSGFVICGAQGLLGLCILFPGVSAAWGSVVLVFTRCFFGSLEWPGRQCFRLWWLIGSIHELPLFSSA